MVSSRYDLKGPDYFEMKYSLAIIIPSTVIASVDQQPTRDHVVFRIAVVIKDKGAPRRDAVVRWWL